MREICTALHAAHQAGVVHRDVKPSNIFGAPETGVRLGDFGIAIANADRPHHEISGTLMFASPEQLRGETVDRRTDVFGAGATAFDLRYGRHPFANLEGILDPAAPPAFPEAQTPAEAYFQHLLSRMLSKDPTLRPGDCAEPSRLFATLARAIRPGATREQVTCIDKCTFRLGDVTVTLSVGNIANEEVDAIVNSANYEMKMRSGVGEALRKRGGEGIEEEAMRGGERPLGECIATGAGTLATKHVLHAVSAWNEASCVGRAMGRALLLSDELGIRTLAFPALGTGTARVSLEMCANAMMSALSWHVALGGTRLHTVRVVLGDERKLHAFREVAEEALRDHENAPTFVDLGLPAAEGEVRADAATHLDAGSTHHLA
jgi:serine/threonine-protein kinase